MGPKTGKIPRRFERSQKTNAQKERDKGKVLLTGASGFVGKRLTNALVQRGYAVRVFVRKSSRIDIFEKLGVEIYYGDIRNPKTVRNAIRGADYIVHAAAAQEGDREVFEQTTIGGTAAVFELAREFNIKRIIYISSMSVYQISGLKAGSLITENAQLEKDPEARGFYTWSKVEAEKIAQQAIKSDDGASTVILRPGTIYGPGSPVLPTLIGLSVFDKIFVVLGRGSMKLPLLYIDNFIDSIIAAMEKEGIEGEVFNIIDDVQITKKEYLRKYIKRAFPKSVSILLPYPFVYAAVLAQELIFSLAKKKPILTRYRLNSASTEISYDNSKAKKKLDWTPEIHIEDGLRKMIVLFKETVV